MTFDPLEPDAGHAVLLLTLDARDRPHAFPSTLGQELARGSPAIADKFSMERSL